MMANQCLFMLIWKQSTKWKEKELQLNRDRRNYTNAGVKVITVISRQSFRHRNIRRNIAKHTGGPYRKRLRGGMNPGKVVFDEIYKRKGQIYQIYKVSLIKSMLVDLRKFRRSKITSNR